MAGWNSKTKKRKNAIAMGFRSGLEEETAKLLDFHKVKYEFEPDDMKLEWHVKSRKKSLSCMECGCKLIKESHIYTVDFSLENGAVLLESKGRFMSADRVKMLAIQELYPDKLVIMLFANPNSKISKGSKTKYKDWCDSKKIKWLDFRDNEWVYKMNRMIVNWKKERNK
jgi:hypothetical protein